ncbi:hypothetical protein L0Y65_06980 [Candidatus Micrarchaeota archaeon]|nr:hypothetical protein [Candidatus Micrarchaeota archaeon]
MTTREYRLASEVDSTSKFKYSRKLAWRLSSRGLAVAVLNQGESVFVNDSPGLEPKEIVDGISFNLSTTPRKANCREWPQLFKEMLHGAFKSRCQELGYVFDLRKHACTEKTPVKVDILEYYRGFSFDVEVFPDGRAGIWVDPKIVWRQPVANLLKRFGYPSNHEQILDYLKGRWVSCFSVAPGVGSYNGQVSDVIFQSIGDYHLPNGTTVYDYLNGSPNWQRWFRSRGITLSKDDGPVLQIKVKGKSEPLSFPPYLVEVLIDLGDELLDQAQKLKIDYGPEQRVKETLQLATRLFSEPLSVGGTNVRINTGLFDWMKKENQVYGKPYLLSSPQLVFGGDNRSPPSNWGPNIKYCLSSFGPITHKEVVGVQCVCPPGYENKVKVFFQELNRVAAAFHLARFELLEPLNIVELTNPTGYALSIKRMNAVPEAVTLTVIPKLSPKTYFYAKKALGDKSISSQMITTDFIEAAQGAKANPNFDKYVLPRIQVMAVQMYDKSLKKGESIWHLAKPAGNMDEKKKTYFMGFDVSRNPENHKESAAYAAVCDNLGRVLHRKTLGSHRGELVSSEELKQWFFDAASDAYLETEKTTGAKVDEIILFKDGRIHHTELPGYRQGAEEAKKELEEHKIMSEKSNIRIVSVVKSGPYRVYGTPQQQFMISEVAIARDNKHAILVTARTRKGSPAALRLNIDFEITPDMDVLQLSQIFNELRYLDWSSIYAQPKTILPLHIVQNLAKLNKEDITVPYIPR